MEINLLQYNFFLKDKPKKTSNNKKNNKNNTTTSKTVLKENNFTTINELKICNKIKKIPYFFNNFQVIVTSKLLRDLNKMPEIINKEECDKYVLINYTEHQGCYLRDFFYNLESPKQVIFHSIETYLHLLKTMITLEKNNITFLDLSPYTIFIENNKPMLQHFENSILNDCVDEAYITSIICNIKDFTYKPLEIHLLFYLIVNDISSLSYALSYEICEHFIENISVLKLFSQEYKQKYKKECADFLNSFINKSRTQIIRYIIQYYYTWDNYSLSILYLHIFGNIVRVFSLRDNFISNIVSHLLKNISIQPSKRERLCNSLEIFNTLFYKDANLNWNYVNSIPHTKIDLLREVLL